MNFLNWLMGSKEQNEKTDWCYDKSCGIYNKKIEGSYEKDGTKGAYVKSYGAYNKQR